MKTTLHYYNSTESPQVGDVIATGKTGQCRILEITLDGEVKCENLLTKEVFHVFADDCDLLSREGDKGRKSTSDQQAESFLAKHGLKLRVTLSDTKTPAWSEDARERGHHYRVTITRVLPLAQRADAESVLQNLRRLTFDFWGSINDAQTGREPSAYGILACISGDATMPETFADFCAEFGYDADSLKALQMFRRCNAFAKRLRAFFTESELSDLAEIQ